MLKVRKNPETKIRAHGALLKSENYIERVGRFLRKATSSNDDNLCRESLRTNVFSPFSYLYSHHSFSTVVVRRGYMKGFQSIVIYRA